MEPTPQNTVVIACKGLPNGSHDFCFALGDAFMATFENTEVTHTQVEARVHLVKKSVSELEVAVTLTGQVDLPCDRCLAPLTLPIERALTLEPEDIEDALEEGTLDLSQYVYDYINLSLPIQRLHATEAECDPEMLRLWRAHSAAPKPSETSGSFDALKDLMKE